MSSAKDGSKGSRKVEATTLGFEGRSIVGGSIGTFGCRTRLWDVVVGLAERAACSTACQPWIHADSVEGMTACQSANVVVILQRIDANSTGVARSFQAFGWQGAVDVFVVIAVFARDSLQLVV
jgi:hypothetical protein